MTAHMAENDTEIFIDGAMYTWVLDQIHIKGLPKSYLEIGTLHGDTLRLSQTKSVAIDPKFRLRDLKFDPARVTLREMTSDDYFDRFRPRADLGRRIDFAFLDGMHEFPYLLRDFINTEKNVARRSVVAMHDCIPRDVYMTRMMDNLLADRRPTNFPGWWAGDVWKMIPVLRKYRPDLEVRGLDAQPTGLTVVSNLDPKNTVLADSYDEIMRDWEHLTLDEYGVAKLFEVTRIESASDWAETLTPFHQFPLRTAVSLLQAVGRVIQPRRRLQKLVAGAGQT